MKCFKVDEGSECFYYAAETKEAVLEAYREDTQDEFEGAEVSEVTDEQMAKITVQMEDKEGCPDEKATLKQVFEDECKGWTGGALQLCGSVY